MSSFKNMNNEQQNKSLLRRLFFQRKTKIIIFGILVFIFNVVFTGWPPSTKLIERYLNVYIRHLAAPFIHLLMVIILILAFPYNFHSFKSKKFGAEFVIFNLAVLIVVFFIIRVIYEQFLPCGFFNSFCD